MIDMKKKIYKALEKKRESIVIDLYLNDYDGSNFYIALVYNRVIEKCYLFQLMRLDWEIK